MLKRLGIVIISVVFLVSLSFARHPHKTVQLAQKKPIKIGAIYNLSGAFSPVDMYSAHGAQLAAYEINKNKGLLHRPLELILRDSKSDYNLAKEIAQDFAQDPDIQVVIGLNPSSMVEVAAPIIANAHKIFISSGATSFYLTKLVPKYLFLTCFSNNVQAAAAAEYVYNYLKLTKGVILFDDDKNYSANLSTYFKMRFKELGGQLPLIADFDTGDLALKKQIKAIKELKDQVQFIFLAGGPSESAYQIKALRDAGLNMPIIGGDAFTSNNILAIAGNDVNDISYVTHGVVDPSFNKLLPALMRQYMATQKFFSAHEELFGIKPDNVYSALGYDTVNLITAAINQARSTNPEKIIYALHHLKNFVGVTGMLNYENGQTVPDKTVSIIRILNGKPNFLGNWLPASVPEVVLPQKHPVPAVAKPSK